MSTPDHNGAGAQPAGTSFSHHPAIAAALASAGSQQNAGMSAPPPVADHRVLREQIEAGYAMVGAMLPPHPEITRSSHTTRSADGSEIVLEWFTAPGRPAGAAVVHAHGGGFVGGSVELFAPFVADYVYRSGVPFLSVDYRLAPQAQGTAPAEDVFAGLTWLLAHAQELGVDPARVAVLGDSAGAGLAAGVAVLARERGLRLARQLLIYPMLDDRTTTDPLLEPFLTLSADFSTTGWRALLGDAQGSDTVSPVAAPGRLQDFTGLAPA
jgi:acetyl esterase/lipase